MNKQAWIDKALELGLEGFEITRTSQNSREISWFEGQMDSYVTSRILSTSFRALSQGKIVSLSLEKVEDDQMEEILGKMAQAAKAVSESEKDELVPVMETEETASLRHWVRPSADQIGAAMARLENKIKEADDRVTRINGIDWSDSAFESELSNSLGVNVQDCGGSQVIVAAVTVEENGDLRDAWDLELVENLEDFDEDSFVKRLVDKAVSQLNARSMKSTTCPVLLTNDAMSTLFGCFTGMFSGSLIAKGISPLTGKVGDKIFSDLVTVIDDPRNQQAVSLQNYDDEGHPTFTKVVVDKGVFETVLHNTKSALKMNASSTGNGFKSGGGATSVQPMNMYIVPGKKSFDELVAEMGNGVVIDSLAGMHAGVDFVSANFSLQAKGYLVENGEKKRPLTLITIAGNFLDLMKRVQAVGNDLDWKAHSVTCPSILFESAAVGGNEE